MHAHHDDRCKRSTKKIVVVVHTGAGTPSPRGASFRVSTAQPRQAADCHLAAHAGWAPMDASQHDGPAWGAAGRAPPRTARCRSRAWLCPLARNNNNNNNCHHGDGGGGVASDSVGSGLESASPKQSAPDSAPGCRWRAGGERLPCWGQRQVAAAGRRMEQSKYGGLSGSGGRGRGRPAQRPRRGPACPQPGGRPHPGTRLPPMASPAAQARTQ